jgi:glycosyltransferase involved in cell wall biosynthesis
VGDGWLKNELEAEAQALGVADRLEVLGKILPQQMVATLEQATLAVVLIESDSISYRLSLPNKFFEAVAAGLPVVATPIPEIKQMVERYDLGVLCEPTPEAIARAILMALESDTLDRLRANVRRARLELNWEIEERKLVNLYREVLQ